EVQETVAKIIEEVRAEGEAAIRRYSEKFDKWSPKSFRLTEEDIAKASKQVSSLDKETINFAHDSVKRFAEKQYEMIQDFSLEMFPGVTLGQKTVPIGSSGSYVPGGTYPIVASANMSITPASVAKVGRIVACTPPYKGELPAQTIYAMSVVGATEIYCLGGVQAVVAMGVGTENMKAVDILVGPGNKFVAEAKRQLYGEVGIDQFAGPSEALIIADDSAEPNIVAADIIAQAEHGPESECVLICLSESFAQAVMKELELQLSVLSTGATARICWENNGQIIVVDSIEEAAEVADEFASEHVEIQTERDDWLMEHLKNYGSLFVGKYSTVAMGDKGIGTNHILPTMHAAKYTGGLWVGKFLKTLTYQRVQEGGLKYVAPYCSLSCAMEGMMGHKESIDKRMVKYGVPVPEYK
ncbi:MAG: histidinol dehydrogenase, partial [Pseudoflavonifractor sp.]